MDCRDVASWLTLRPESAEDQAALDAHLHTCPACAARAQRASALDQAVQSSLVLDPPPALTVRLRALAREAAQIPPLPKGEGWGEGRPVPSPRWGEGRNLQRPRGHRQSQLAALTIATALAASLWTLLNPEALPTTVAFVWGIVISIQAILSSPAGRLLANPFDALAPVLPVVGAFLLAGVLAHEASRPPRPRRVPTSSL